MNHPARLGSLAFSARLSATFALAALLAVGCTTTIRGGSGGDSSSGGVAGSTATGGTGGSSASGGATTTSVGGSTISTSTLPSCDNFLGSEFGVGFTLHETGILPDPPLPGSPNILLSASGTVTSVGSGAEWADCGTIPPDYVGNWASFTDASGKSWTICFIAPDASWSIGVGDSIQATMNIAVGYYEPNSADMTVRKGGALAFFGVANTGGTIPWPQEVSISNGDPFCFNESWDSCAKTGYNAVVSSGGATVTIFPGNTSTVGGFLVGVGQWKEITDGGSCDLGSARRGVFVVPAP
ncbi:MAG: hypothetical protein U0441_33435 [Polyangiaceae bacterium]